MTEPTGEQIHDLPEYDDLATILHDVKAAFVTGNTNVTANYIDQVINFQILTHIAQHHIREVAPDYVSSQLLVQAAYLPMARMFIDGFLAGAKLQGKRDAAFTGNVTVPDDPTGLDAA